MAPSIHDREAEQRERALAVMAVLYPGVMGNPYIPHRPHPKQMVALGAHVRAAQNPNHDPDDVFELLFGGAAGGGKSDTILMAAVQYVDDPNYAGVCIRRSYAELAKPGALMDRALKWWLAIKRDDIRPHWNAKDKIFTFPSGARIQMAYHGSPKDDMIFQGPEYQFVGWDELTHWPDDTAYEWVTLSRQRRLEGSNTPPRGFSASNPGGPGHVWVRDRFPGTIGLTGGQLYIPATIDDNPSLDRAPYIKTLMRMHPTKRAQLLAGDWRARDPGDYFRAEWFGHLLPPDLVRQQDRISIRWWDLAASEAKTAARTAGVLMSRLRHGARVIEHARAFRATPGRRDAEIMRQARLDGKEVIIGLELEGGSGGPAQVEAIAKMARAEGFRVVWARPRAQLTDAEGKTMMKQPVAEKGKTGRADPVASCLERGYQRRGECSNTGEPWWGEDTGLPFYSQRDGLLLCMGAWTQGYLDEIEGFPEADLLDLVDATSGAWAWLEAHPFGLRGAPGLPHHVPEAGPAHERQLHPEERAYQPTRGGILVPQRHAGRHAML